MKHIWIVLISLVTTEVLAGDTWKQSLAKPVAIKGISSHRMMVPTEKQVSCEHIRFRYSQTVSLLKDLNWLVADLFGTPDYKDVFEYINNRASVDLRPIASQQQVEVKFTVPVEKVQTDFQAIGVVKATDFEQLTTQYPERVYSSFVKNENGSLTFTTKVNAFDVCEKKSVEVLFLSSCPEEVTNELPCSDAGLCTDGFVADWQACETVSAVRVDLSSLEEKIGYRAKVIKKVW